MYGKLKELTARIWPKNYLRQLEDHEIYRHDETAVIGKPYCASVTLYPFLFQGNTAIGGTSEAPKNLAPSAAPSSTWFLLWQASSAAQFRRPEWLSYMDYFIRKEYGDDYYLHVDDPGRSVQPAPNH